MNLLTTVYGLEDRFEQNGHLRIPVCILDTMAHGFLQTEQ